MRTGDILNGYQIITEPTNAGGGMSQWAFARKDGRDYFVKMFLAPKFPLPDAPGSSEAKARKLAACLAFEQRHIAIGDRIDPTVPGAGNLVVPVEFFRVDATYVKVMERIVATALPEAHTLSGRQLLVILRTLVFSLRLLHQKDIVHGDLKPDNVLVEQTSHGLLVSKLIDFDEAYLVGAPPPPDQIVGDPSYYSPELLQFIKGHPEVEPGDLTTASDMFSLGLLLHRFLVGRLPSFDRTWATYPCEAVAAGHELDVTVAPVPIRDLLRQLLLPTPADRPAIDAVIDFLAEVDGDQLVPSGPPPPDPARPAQVRVGLRPMPEPSPATVVATGVLSESGVGITTPAPVPSSSRIHSTLSRGDEAADVVAADASEPEGGGGPGLRSTIGRRRTDGDTPDHQEAR
jgi:serine/threonine protein kinase